MWADRARLFGPHLPADNAADAAATAATATPADGSARGGTASIVTAHTNGRALVCSDARTIQTYSPWL